ncbi:MAG: CDP-diacylglycerol--glycerol-3-phosphate 3-phosphatidyltransferase [Marinibacterium sp.]
MHVTFPTILTILRLLAAPAVALAFVLLPRPIGDWSALILFALAAATDWIDGRLARAWGQVTRLGTMLDPIADKVMVAAALVTLSVVSSLSWAVMLPAVLILSREVFISGLREYLGHCDNPSGLTLAVTPLAKWKTTVQMLAISVLFGHGIAEHHAIIGAWGMDDAMVAGIIDGSVEDIGGLLGWMRAMQWAARAGLVLLWLAAILTLWTGVDYFLKARPLLKEPE